MDSDRTYEDAAGQAKLLIMHEEAKELRAQELRSVMQNLDPISVEQPRKAPLVFGARPAPYVSRKAAQRAVLRTYRWVKNNPEDATPPWHIQEKMRIVVS